MQLCAGGSDQDAQTHGGNSFRQLAERNTNTVETAARFSSRSHRREQVILLKLAMPLPVAVQQRLVD